MSRLSKVLSDSDVSAALLRCIRNTYRKELVGYSPVEYVSGWCDGLALATDFTPASPDSHIVISVQPVLGRVNKKVAPDHKSSYSLL